MSPARPRSAALPTEPEHPGTILREEFLEPRRADIKATAKRLGVSRQTLYRIFSGAAPVTPEMALRLERLTGASAMFWLNLQAQYDLWFQARALKEKRLALASDLSAIRPFGEDKPAKKSSRKRGE